MIPAPDRQPGSRTDGDVGASHEPRDSWERARLAMVERQIAARGITDPRVLGAMQSVPRHAFVPEPERAAAYADRPLPIGHDQTISQPFIVALMTALLELQGHETVLEVGTGCGYQTAVLGQLARTVHSVEIVPELAARATATLAAAGIDNVSVHVGDGRSGWPAAAPYDAILVTAAPATVPEPLLEQLRTEGGRLVLPLGPGEDQRLMRFVRTASGIESETIAAVRFVPLTGGIDPEAVS
jgi:protein-L-isoaspartate(D-aspartate) O-methyltransferase